MPTETELKLSGDVKTFIHLVDKVSHIGVENTLKLCKKQLPKHVDYMRYFLHTNELLVRAQQNGLDSMKAHRIFCYLMSISNRVENRIGAVDVLKDVLIPTYL